MVLPGLVTLQPYHLQEILELESHIQQYSKNEIDPVSKREILRQFLDLAGQGQFNSHGLEDADGKLKAYFFLLMDPELIQTFFNPKETDLKRCAYLAQIVVKPGSQSAGIGSKLMDLIEESARNAGKDKLLLEVHSQAKAFRWYQHRNYQEICSQVFMSKKL